jgi:hypothetical protein
MKISRYLTVLFLPVLFCITACSEGKPKETVIENVYATISIDTTYTDAKGFVLASTFHNGKYYVFCGENMYVMKQNGVMESIEKITLHTDLFNQIPDYRIKVEDDGNIIIRYLGYEYDRVFEFNKREWIKVPADNIIYEDESYIIERESYGEFGGLVYFRDKATGAKYEALCPYGIKVNYFQNKYYVTSYLAHLSGFSSIIEIEDPHLLHSASPEQARRTGEIETLPYIQDNKEFLKKGSKVIFNKIGMRIHTTFVHKGRLLIVYTEGNPALYTKQENMVHIAAVTSGELEPVYTFKPKMRMKYDGTLSDGSQFLSFNAEDGDFGFIHITSEKVAIHYMLGR